MSYPINEETAVRSARGSDEARRQLLYEVVGGVSALALTLFMWGHMFFVGSILLGTRGFDWVADGMERLYIAQPTVFLILALFLLHALLAARKIPAQLRERRRMIALARSLKRAPAELAVAEGRHGPHLESWLWIWQLRTGIAILVLGSFHLILMAMDILTPLFGARVGIEAATSMARVGSGLVLPYAILLLCVEFHAGVGLYRMAVKWGAGARLSRRQLWRLEKIIFWGFLGLGAVTLVVLAGWLPPPLAFLLGD